MILKDKLLPTISYNGQFFEREVLVQYRDDKFIQVQRLHLQLPIEHNHALELVF